MSVFNPCAKPRRRLVPRAITNQPGTLPNIAANRKFYRRVRCRDAKPRQLEPIDSHRLVADLLTENTYNGFLIVARDYPDLVTCVPLRPSAAIYSPLLDLRVGTNEVKDVIFFR